MDVLKQISEFLQNGDDEKVFELTRQAIAQNISPKDILDNGLIAGMNIIGEQFGKHEIFLPEVLLAAKAMYAGMDLLKPLLIKDEIPTLGKIVIGTVHGDLHDLGKNLVGITAEKENAKIIGMSALLTTTMPVMKSVTDILKERGLDGTIKTIIGGAPISDEYVREIGADVYAYDAAKAVECVKQLAGVK